MTETTAGLPTETETSTSTATDTETPTATMTMTLAGTPTEEPPAPFTGAYYTYDGDDNLVMSVVNGVTTYYAASSYVVEVDGETTTVKKTYMAGSTSIAVRTILGEEDTLNWVLGDHLGSASVTTTVDGTWYSELRFSAFGETRYSSGITPTDYRYTGQLEQADVNLYYYNARWYDPALGRFIQADTIVPEPGSLKSYDRFTYVDNNPMKYIDPSGHCIATNGSIRNEYPSGTSGLCSDYEITKYTSRGPSTVKDYQKILSWYGVTLVSGNLTPNDAAEITTAVRTIAAQLASVDPQGRGPSQVFKAEYGPRQIQSKDPDASGSQYCDHSGYGFYCHNMAGHWDKYLAAHELGHDFAQANGKVPYTVMFDANQYNSQGKIVFGSIDGTYKRTFLGMLSDQPPYAYHGHALYPGDVAQLTQNEDFADTFSNWVYDSFNYDAESIINGVKNADSGTIRKNWMDVNMAEWLKD